MYQSPVDVLETTLLLEPKVFGEITISHHPHAATYKFEKQKLLIGLEQEISYILLSDVSQNFLKKKN